MDNKTVHIEDSERLERVRKAVIKRGGNVTVGDIISETGLGADEAKESLRLLIQTHEGTMRVSEKGDILYAFAPGCILRDQRSWWERNKKAVLKVIKALFKIIIMLVLVIYFVIYLIILIALLSQDRNGRSSSDGLMGHAFYFFWGYGSADTGRSHKQPLYTRVYNFVFGPEEEEVDPLQARTQCAQLIRAKNGVITSDDWMMISGQSRAKCDSDLARYTAEFDGTAEITENGTLVYVFEDMMKSTDRRKQATMPAPAWRKLELRRPMTGNPDGNGAVIGLNTFNLIMSFFFMYGGSALVDEYSRAPQYVTEAEMGQAQSIFAWLGIFPFIFSSLIFLVPLIRLPFNIKENRARRERNLHRAALATVFSGETRGNAVTVSGAEGVIQKQLRHGDFDLPSQSEVVDVMSQISDELGGDVASKGVENAFTFDMLDVRNKDAEVTRRKYQLEKNDVGRVIFSTDNREQEECEDHSHAADLDDFDRALQGGSYESSYGEQETSKRGQHHAY